MLNSHWLLEREFVADERSGSLDVDTLGYSLSGGGHWPLTGVGSRSEMLNSYWPSAHPGSLGHLSWALNFDWLSGGSFFSAFSGTSWAVAGREELLEMHWQWQMHQSSQWGGEMQAARCRKPNSCGFHKGVG